MTMEQRFAPKSLLDAAIKPLSDQEYVTEQKEKSLVL